jgi:hypothetical protein
MPLDVIMRFVLAPSSSNPFGDSVAGSQSKRSTLLPAPNGCNVPVLSVYDALDPRESDAPTAVFQATIPL